MFSKFIKHSRSISWLFTSVTALLFLAFFVAKVVSGPSIANAAAGINEQINFQGRLLTASGAVVPDGTYNMEFKVYQDGNGVLGGGDETLEWTETRESGNKVLVKNGYFSVYLGSVTPFSSSVDWNQDTLWLSINVGGTGAPSYDGEMSPFNRLGSVPSALNSKYLGGLASSSFIQLAQGIQTDGSSTNPSIAINKTAGTAALLQLQRGGADVLTVSNSGAALFKNSTDSTTAFQVQSSGSSTPVLNVDTTNSRVGIGTATPGAKLDLQATSSSGTAGTEVAQNITFSDSGAVSSGTEITKGLAITVSRTGGSGSATLNTYGLDIVASGDTGGTSNTYGISAVAYYGDNNYGFYGGGVNVGSTVSTNSIGVWGGVATYFGGGGTVTNAYGLQGSVGMDLGAFTYDTAAGLNILSASNFSGGTINTNYGIKVEAQTAGGVDYGIRVDTAETQTLWLAGEAADPTTANAGIAFGSGRDTNLYRGAADTLKTDDAFNIVTTSATALLVQNASAADTMFTVDTAARSGSGGNRIKIGNSTGSDTALTVLQLDAAAADPTTNLAALNGGLFYDSNTNKIKIIENGVVKIVCNTTDAGCGAGGSTSLQSAYDNSSSPASILLADGKNFVINAADTATDPSIVFNLQCTTSCSTNGRFAVQSGSTDVFTVSPNGGAVLFKNTTDSTTAFQVQSSSSTTPVLNVDTVNRRIGINTNSPQAAFQVGDITDQGDIHLYGEITRKGVTQQTGLTGINDVFIYDVTADSDGGAWADSEAARSLGWYNESKDDGVGDACNIASDDRCGEGRFPRKAMIVATDDAVYIFDAVDQKLFMKFTQGGTYALGADINNNPSSVFALNGVLYVGTNGSAATGMYAFDFMQDRVYNYNTTDRDQGDKSITNRNTAVTYATDSRTAMAIRHNAVNAVHGAVLYGSSSIETNGGPLNGVTFIAAATDDSMSVINLSGQQTLDYGDNLTDQFSSVYVTRRGRLYGMNVTLAQVERYGTQATGSVGIDVAKADQITPTDVWDEQAANLPNLSKTTPTFLVGAPDALKVLERGSLADDAADRIYVGHSQGMTEIHDVNVPSATVIGWSQFVKQDGTTMHMSGNAKGMFRFDETTGDLNDDTRSASILEAEVAPTYNVPGVRGTALRFDGTSQFLCSDANNDGTCDTDADFNVAAVSSHIKAWFKHSATITGTDVLIDRRYTALAGVEGVGYTVEMNASGQMVYGIQDTAATAGYDDSVTSTQSYNDNQWHYLVAVNTDTGICLFIDGKLAVACDTALAATLTLDASQILTIGADASGAAGGNFWDGDIDDVYFAGGGSTTSSNQTQAQIRKQYLAGRSALARPSTRVTNATTVSSTTIGHSSEAYTPNSFAASFVEITSGTGAGQTRRIVSNDATTFTVSPAWTVAPDTTSDYEVMPEQLYGNTDIVTSIGMSDANAFLGTSRNLYIGTNSGSDGGGVTVFGGYGNEYVSDLYHSDSGAEDSSGNDWTGSGSDDINAIDGDNGNVVFGSGSSLWREKFDRNILQELDSLIGNLGSVRAELIVDGLLGTSSETGNMGGADLAERFTSDEELTPGTLVSLEDNRVGAVRKSSGPYDKKLVGIVATDPGLIIGPHEETSYPIALAGRVPVNVMLLPGQIIKSGDRITSSSLAGYGMKATVAGRVVGSALEDVDETLLIDCPEGAPEGAKCGTITALVNLVDFGGESIEIALEDFEEGGLVLPDSLLDPISVWFENETESTDASKNLQKSDKLLRYLSARQQSLNDGPESEILTDRVSSVEVNTVSLVAKDIKAGTITVDKIRANQIEGLEILTNKIDSLAAARATSVAPQQQETSGLYGTTENPLSVPNSLSLQTVVVKLDLSVEGTLFAKGALKVEGPLDVYGQSVFHKFARFVDRVVFEKDTEFKGKLVLNNENVAGYAVIHQGQKEVVVKFKEPYQQPPVVTVTVKNGLFVTHTYKDLSKDGFTVILDANATQDVEFAWTALQVDDAKTTHVPLPPEPIKP